MELYYTKDHEWIKIEGLRGTIGITVYAAQQLGDITFVDLPKIGKDFKQGDILCAIESVKAASDIYAPMSCKVVEVNNALDSEPQIINSRAESDGWIAELELSNLSEKEKLMNKNQYDKYLKGL